MRICSCALPFRSEKCNFFPNHTELSAASMLRSLSRFKVPPSTCLISSVNMLCVSRLASSQSNALFADGNMSLTVSLVLSSRRA